MGHLRKSEGFTIRETGSSLWWKNPGLYLKSFKNIRFKSNFAQMLQWLRLHVLHTLHICISTLHFYWSESGGRDANSKLRGPRQKIRKTVKGKTNKMAKRKKKKTRKTKGGKKKELPKIHRSKIKKRFTDLNEKFTDLLEKVRWHYQHRRLIAV